MNRKDTICFANLRKGTGKTTLAAWTALAWAEAGKKVLVVDLDPQGDITRLFDPFPDKEFVLTIKEDLMDGDPVSYLKTENPNIRIYPANLKLATIDQETTGKEGRETMLADLLEKIEGFDRVIIDTPPQLGLIADLAANAAAHVVYVVQHNDTSYDAMRAHIAYLNKYNENRPEFIGAILNNFSDDVPKKELERLRTQYDGMMEPFIRNIKEPISPKTDVPWKIYDLASVIEGRMNMPSDEEKANPQEQDNPK